MGRGWAERAGDKKVTEQNTKTDNDRTNRIIT